MSFWAIAKIIWVVEFVESVDFSVFLLFFKIRMGVHESTEASNKIQINTKKTQHCTKASLAFPIIQNTTLVDAKAEYHPVTKTDGPFLGHTGYSLRPVTSTFTNKTMLQHFNGHQKLGEEEGKLFVGIPYSWGFLLFFCGSRNTQNGQLPNAMLADLTSPKSTGPTDAEKAHSYTFLHAFPVFLILCRFPSDPCMVDLPLQSYTCTKQIKQMWVTIYTMQWDFCVPPNLLRNNICCQNFEVTGVAGSERPAGKCSHGHLNDC